VVAHVCQWITADDAEDVGQETILILRREMRRGRVRNAKAYALAVATNLVRASARRTSVARRVAERYAPDIANATTGRLRTGPEVVAQAEAKQCAGGRRQDVPERLQRSGCEYLFEDADTTSIARNEGTTPGAIRQRVARTRKHLRENSTIRQWLAPLLGLSHADAEVKRTAEWWDAVSRIVHRPLTHPGVPSRGCAGRDASAAAIEVLTHVENGHGLEDRTTAAVAYGAALYAVGRWEDAARWYRALSELAARNKDRLGLALSYTWQAEILTRCGRPLRALHLLRAALSSRTNNRTESSRTGFDYAKRWCGARSVGWVTADPAWIGS
jgi:DNA-directed RNA polymerase specialized sigma24 family protein